MKKEKVRMSFARVCCAVLVAALPFEAGAQVWTPVAPDTIGGPHAVQGPGPSQNGQLEGIPNRPVTGAINAPGARTRRTPTSCTWVPSTAASGGPRTPRPRSPVWMPLTDAQSSLSIGRDALQFDPTDASGNTLVAGSGRSSSFRSNGGARIGMLRTTNGGATWTVLTAAARSPARTRPAWPRAGRRCSCP